MTENEAIKKLEYRIFTATDIAGCGIDGKSYEDMEMAIKALEDVQQYRTLEQRVKDKLDNKLNLNDVVDSLDRVWNQMTDEPDSPYPKNTKILTYKEAADWDAYRAIGTVEECRTAVEKQKNDKELESHDEKHILKYCISLMWELVGKFEEWYKYVHGEDAIKELDEKECFCYRMSYFNIVQELFLFGTSHSGGTSTRTKCEQLGVDSGDGIEFSFGDDEE